MDYQEVTIDETITAGQLHNDTKPPLLKLFLPQNWSKGFDVLFENHLLQYIFMVIQTLGFKLLNEKFNTIHICASRNSHSVLMH